MNILFVVENSSIENAIKKALEDNKAIFTDNYYFDYIEMIYHIDNMFMNFKKVEDEYLCEQEDTCFIPLTLKTIDIPNETYLQRHEIDFPYNKNINHSTIDVVVNVCCHPCVCEKLAFAKYVEHFDIKNAVILNINDLTEPTLIKALQLKDIIDFEKDLQMIKELLSKSNDEYEL